MDGLMHPKIKIPVSLWNKVSHTRRKRKAVATFLVLKCVCESGKFCDTPAVTNAMATAAGESVRNFRRRIDEMISIGLLSYSVGKPYQLASWETVQEIFELPHNNKFYHVPYAQNAENKYDLEDELFQLATRDAVLGQKKAIRATLNANESLRQDIKTAAGATHSEAVFHAQLRCWLKEGQGYDDNDQFALLETDLRCDTQCSTAHYNYLFEYHGRGSWKYRKDRMELLGLIKVFHRRYELPTGSHTTLEGRKCDFGHVEWIDGKLWLILPDEIVFFSPKERAWMQAPVLAANAA